MIGRDMTESQEDPDNPRLALGAAKAYLALGYEQKAEELLLAAREWAGSDDELREKTVAVLLGLYKKQGRHSEARAVRKREAEIQRLVRAIHKARMLGVPPPQRRKNPKVGRNDPCPCGSGKKYKKCCLPKDA